MNLTDYSKQAILKHILGVQAMSLVTPYIALSTSVGEPVGNGYARQAVTFQITGTEANNSTTVSHVATGDWGTLQTVFIADALIDGNMLFWNYLLDENGLKRSVIIDSEEHRFEIGGIEVSFTGNGSDWLNTQTLQHLLGISEFTMPTEHWLAIFGDDTNLQAGTGSFSEPTTGGYARQSCKFNADGSLKNKVEFAMATAPYDQRFKYLGIMSAETSGNVIFYKELDAEREVKTGGQVWFPENTGLGFELD